MECYWPFQKGFLLSYVVGFVASACLHSIGIYLLYRVKLKLINQRIIIANLALSELASSVHHTLIAARRMAGLCQEVWDDLELFFNAFLLLSNRLIMFHLVLDRFLDIFLHMKYPLYFTKSRLVKIAFVGWIVSCLYAMFIIVGRKATNSSMYKYTTFTFLIVDICISISAVLTFIYLNARVRKISSSNLATSSKYSRVRFFIPWLMILTYLFFNVSSQVLQTIANLTLCPQNCLLLQTGTLLTMMGYISDVCIYMFLNKSLREGLVEAVIKWRAKVNGV